MAKESERVAPPSIRYRDGGAVAVGAIYCIGRNYAEHARELGNPRPVAPVVFLKSPAALRRLAMPTGAGEAGPLAFAEEAFHHEAELILLLGEAVGLGEAAGWGAIGGVSLGIDLTRRGVQDELKRAGLPWTAAKSFAGSALVGDFVPLDQLGDPANLEFRLAVAGEPRQHGRVVDMLFDVPAILAHLALSHPLRPGDLVFTGTPAGVATLRRGDAICLTLDRGDGHELLRVEGRL